MNINPASLGLPPGAKLLERPQEIEIIERLEILSAKPGLTIDAAANLVTLNFDVLTGPGKARRYAIPFDRGIARGYLDFVGATLDQTDTQPEPESDPEDEGQLQIGD